jgi:hypothetical protein
MAYSYHRGRIGAADDPQSPTSAARGAGGRSPRRLQRSPRIIRIPGIDEVIGIVLIDRAPSFASV